MIDSLNQHQSVILVDPVQQAVRAALGTYVPPEKLIESDDPVLRIIGEMLIRERGTGTA